MSQEAQQLYNELEQVLRQHGLWLAASPQPSRLTSQVPFAVDSLTFCEWLQFIMLPKLRALSAQGYRLPEMSVAPAAQVYLPQQVESGSADIIAVLRQLDTLASQS